jgi:hypothetical protein
MANTVGGRKEERTEERKEGGREEGENDRREAGKERKKGRMYV